ncbi:MAG: hypothetical protein VX607_11880 [Planctomycetota bacterium]|nr:hypothetical protein [Planctomycetota bacterium]
MSRGIQKLMARGLSGLVLLIMAGCGDSGNAPSTPVSGGGRETSSVEKPDPFAPAPLEIRSKPVVSASKNDTRNEAPSQEQGVEGGPTEKEPMEPALPPRTLGDLIAGDDRPFESTRMEIDPERVRSHGILAVQGTHLHLYSDLRNQGLLQELVAIFDAAVPLWCELLHVDPAETRDWYVTGFLVQDTDKMRQAGLFPNDLPPFPNGFSRGFEFWFYEQPSAFYRRYLMLHEGTHAFMQQMLGGRGAPWYSEGMAEYLSVHEWDGKTLKLKQTIDQREDAPLWGRVKLVKDAFASGQGFMPKDIMMMEDEQFLQNVSYGWAWALCHFLDRHPKCHDAFVALESNIKDRSPAFAQPLVRELQGKWPEVQEDWQVFLSEIDYGYDLERMAVDYKPVADLSPGRQQVSIRADRGWQSTGLRLQPGDRIEISATGRFLLRTGDEEWPSEPGGITIDYYAGRPLGQLIAAVCPDNQPDNVLTALLSPVSVGERQGLQSEQGGVLFLRLNDAPNRLSDNEGEAQVTIEKK